MDDFTGGIRMRASEIFDLREARERSVKRLKVILDSTSLSHDFADELAGILSPFRREPGQGCPVHIAYSRTDAEADIALGENWRVLPDDDLLQNLRDHFGAEQVQLDY